VGLLVLASGTFARVVGSRLVVHGDTAATAANLLASELLYRLGMLGSLAMMIAWLFYALLLRSLLRPAGRALASTMLALVLAAVPLYMLNQAHAYGALLSATSGALDRVGLYLELQRFGALSAGIFFGLWLVPLGLLVLRSGFLPKTIGILLLVGSPGYLILFVQGFLVPESEPTLWSNPFLAVTHLAELSLLLWLLVRGVNVDRWEERAAAGPVAAALG